MLTNDRHDQILKIINSERSISTKKLMSILFVSEATVRRDLSYMEEKGLLKRVHGGAIIINSPASEESSLIREQILVREKKRMAQEALRFIDNGYSCFIDSSTTVGHIIPLLNEFKELSIVTNGIHCALMFIKFTKFDVILTNGRVNFATGSTVGVDTVSYIKQFNCNVFIFSCSGISLSNGITEANIEQMRTKQEMIRQSSMHVLLVDHTKFDKIFFAKTCDFDRIDVIITDLMPSNDYVELFKKQNIRLIIA